MSTDITTDKTLPILIVDDNVQYAQLLRRILENGFGFTNITSLPDSHEAKELIMKEPDRFKMLFIDFNFPTGYSGGQLLQELSNAHLLDGKAAFLITSEPSTNNVEQASLAGALGVVVKPFNRADLELKIRKGLHYLDPTETF